MKKLAAVLLSLALMVVLVDVSSLSAVIESEADGVGACLIESYDSASASFMVESEAGGLGAFAVESPDSSLGVFMIESEPGGSGISSIEVLDGLGVMKLVYAQYYYLFH